MGKGQFRPRQCRNPLTDLDHIWHVKLHTAGHPPSKVSFWSDDVRSLDEWPVYHCFGCFSFFLPFFLLRDADMHSAYLLRRRGWLAGWVYVTHRYFTKTAKSILKLFRQSGRSIILVSSDSCADTQFQGTPPAGGGVKYTGDRKIWRLSCAIYLRNGAR